MKKQFILLLPMLLVASTLFGHTIAFSLEERSEAEVFVTYLREGFLHILPFGIDHILFILCVFFLNTNLKSIILQASMFTLAHTITLGLSMYGLISAPGNVVEPLIALSIVFLAIENIYSAQKIKPWRLIMVFLFGLIHGMGFAGALNELGMPQYAFASALISFNLGVELGQLCIILFMYFCVNRLFAHASWYRSKIVVPASIIIAVIAGYWTIERILFMA